MDGFNIDNYLRISLTDVVLVLISTLLIVLIAKRFFWDKIIAFMESRQNMIQENIDFSHELRDRAAAEKEEYDEKLKNVGKEAHEILENARAQAGAEKKQILEAAENEASRMRDKAAEDIERDRLAAEKDMRAAISDVAIAAAKKIVQKEMDEATQIKFVDDFIEQAGESQW